MQAIEFEAFINHMAIQIPQQYRSLDNVMAKVIVLYPQPTISGNYNKKILLNCFEQARKKNIYQNIEDSVKWQKEQRDEWE